MGGKSIAIFLVIVLCLGSISIIPDNMNVKADYESQGDLHLDTRYVYNITSDLSNIIFQAYNTSELQKGREFGSKGEHEAADYIYDLIVSIETVISGLIEYSI